MTFSTDEVEALRSILTGLSGVDIVLVGAAALRSKGRFSWRTTSDLDLTVALDADQYPGVLSNLEKFKRDSQVQHRWWFNHVKVDIIPAGPSLRKTGFFRLDDREINLGGFHLAFAHAIETKVDDIVVRIAPVPVIVVLKMFAYADRPYDRERDLQDISYLLDEYIGNDDDRRFVDRLPEAIDWDHISAHELGYDIGLVVGPTEQGVVTDFLRRVRGNDSLGTLQRMMRSGSPLWRVDEVSLLKAIDLFEQGFRAGQTAVDRPTPKL